MADIALNWTSTGQQDVAQGFDRQRRSVQQLREELERLSRAQRSSQGGGTSSNRSASSFRAFSQAVSGTNRELTGLQTRLRQYQAANAALARSLNVSVGTVRRLNSSLGTLPGQTANITARFAELRAAGETSVRTFDQLNREFGISREQFQTLESTIGASTVAMGAIAAAAGAAATAIAGIFRGGLESFLAFEGAIRTLSVVTGETIDDLGSLNDEAVRLGASTAFSNAEVANLAVQLSRAGFSARQTEDALAGVVQTAAASGTDLQTAGRTVGQLVNQFNLAASEATTVGDSLVAAANNTATSVPLIGAALTLVGGAAANLNQSLPDTAAAIGLLANAGIQGTRAGTTLSQVLTRLSNEAAKNSENFQRLGVEVRDANGNFRPLLDIIPEIRRSLESLSEGDRQLLINQLFGERGSRAFFALLSETDDGIQNLRGTINDSAGTGAEAAETLLGGLGGALTQLNSISETTSATFGQFLAPAAEAVVRSATALLGAFNQLPGPIQGALVASTAFAGVLSAAVAAIAAYTVASQALNVELIRQNLSIIANTVAKGGATVATVALTAAQSALAVATGRATAAQAAQLATLGGLAATLGAVAGAAGSVFLVVDTFNEVDGAARSTREAIDSVNEALQRLEGGSVEATVEVNRLQQVLDNIRGVIPGLATATEAAANRQTVAFGGLVDVTEDVLQNADEVINALQRGEDIDSASIEATARALEEAGTALSEQTGLTEQSAAVQQSYIGFIERTEQQLQALASGSDSVAASTESLNESVEQNAQALEEQAAAAEAAAASLEQQRETARELAEIEFNISNRRGAIADRRAQQAEARAFQAEQAATQERLETELRAEEAAFNEREAVKARENAERIQNFQEEGARRIEQIQADAQERISVLNEESQDRIQQVRTEGEARIEQERLAAERRLLLDEADGRSERRELEERFEAEDEAAARRLEAFEPVRDAEMALQEEIAAIEAENQEAVQAIRLETEQTVADFRKTLQEAEQEFRLQQEEALSARRQELEESQAGRREELEARLQAESLAFQISQEDAAFNAQLARQAQQREFQAEQRRLDEASAQRIEQIRGNVGTPSVPAFREGGTAPGGPALVGEAGPEIVNLPRGSHVLSNPQSADIARQAMQQNPALATPFVRGLGTGAVGMQNNSLAHGNTGRIESLLNQQISLMQQSGIIAQGMAQNISKMGSGPNAPFSQVLADRQRNSRWR